jgi:hypothetical protein
MLAKLTFKLAALPEQMWPRFAAAHASAEPLPSPLMHVAGVGFLSVVATGLGWAVKPGATFAGAVLQMLAALVGYVGGAALAVELSPKLISSPGNNAQDIARFASGAVLPVALSGVLNVIPLIPMNLVLALAGAALSFQSAMVGASAMLALEGQSRKRAATVPVGLAVGLVVLATFVRMGLPK